MKTIQTVLLFTFMLLSMNTVSAQYGNNGYGNGYGNNGYGNGYGGNNRMGSAMNQERYPEKQKEIPVEVTVGKIVDNLKTEINLDELQVIAISNVLKESIKEQGILMKDETSSQENKIKEIQALSETTNRKITEFLNKDQKEKFTAYIEASKNPKKRKV